MNTENLQVGMTVANYRALCKLLDEPEKGGDSKKAQVKEWARYFSFEKKGYAFTITEIYDTPQLTQDKRAKYTRYIEPILSSFLGEMGGEYETTLREWYTILGMVKRDVFDETRQEKFLDDYFVFNRYTFRRVLLIAESAMRNHLFSSLDSFQKKGFLSYEKNLYIKKDNGIVCKASTEECKNYDALKKSIIANLNCKSMFGIYLKKSKNDEFYKLLKSKIKELYGWLNAYTLVHVTGSENYISLYDDVNIEPFEEKLHQEVIASVREQVNHLITNDKAQHNALLEAEDYWGESLKSFQLPAFFESEADFMIEEFLSA